tara:strand:+ start:3060 stop:3671 length:612 start_codon:yes stop_codon:yes gene_type:complete
MNFNGKSLIILGFILFFLQIINFFSITVVNPEIARAQVLAALSSIIIILIGLLFERFSPISGEKVDLKGENKFLYDNNLKSSFLEELAWGSETILTSTAAASVLIHHKGKNIIKRGIINDDIFLPGETCLRSMRDMKLISLANTKFYPGKNEFDKFCPQIPSILIIPINKEAFILVGGWSSRCFTKSDEEWLKNWARKLSKNI